MVGCLIISPLLWEPLGPVAPFLVLEILVSTAWAFQNSEISVRSH